MKTLIWVLVIVGGVNCDTIAYPGRSALLAYNPARGEFPVQSLFGRGYFSYIDQNGNSRIVSLEPNPLLGVRVGANGQPQIEIGRSIDLDYEKKEGTTDRKHDRLKPIKEFDEKPFLDSVDPIAMSTSEPGVVQDATKEALVAASMPIIMYLPPTTPKAVVPGQNIVNPLPNSLSTSAPEGPRDVLKDSLFSTPMESIVVPGPQGPTIMYLPPTAPESVAPGQNVPNPVQNTLGTTGPDSSRDVPKDSLFSTPMQPIAIPGQQGPTIMYLPPTAPNAVVPMQLLPSSPDAVKEDSKDRPKVSFATPMQPSTIPDRQGQVNMYLPPIKPETIVPRQLFSNPSPPTGTSEQGTFNPSNPFLFSNAGLNRPPPINSGAVLSNPSSTACVFPNPSPPSMPEIVFPNSPMLTGSGVFPNPVQPATESPYLSGAPLTIRPPSTVFPNPAPPVATQGVFPNPKPPAVNPFTSQGGQNIASLVAPIIPLDPLVPNVNNPFLPNLLIDVRVEPKARSLLEGTNPKLVIETPEVEQAKREHFLAHKLALARLEKAQQQSDNDNNDQVDESLTSPLASAFDSSSVYLAADAAASQTVTSAPSTVEITEQTNVITGGTGSEDVSQALPVV